MSDIVVPNGLKEKVLEVIGGRRERLAVVAVLVALIGVASLLWLRGAPAKIAPPAPVGPPRAERGSGPHRSSTMIFVHVAGAVRRPGLYRLKSSARVATAVQRAGPKPSADLDLLNLAQPLTDGAKVDVPRRGQVTGAPGAVAAPPGTVAPPPGAPSPTATTTAPINVNTADALALEAIPDVGPVTAQAIVDYRTENGPFESVEELLEVSGIGPATLETMRPHVTV
jgi:competence protein ComEA